MAGTTVIYNGVTLGNVNTREWDETIEYDETGTDPIGTRYRLTFDCIMHQQALPVYETPVYVDDGGVFTNPVERLKTLKRKLKAVRKPLEILFNGNVVLRVNPFNNQSTLSGTQTDTNNGPKPTKVSIYHIAGDKAFRIRFSIECMTLDCSNDRTGSHAYAINNRWGIREAMDENFTIMRTITGSLRLAASPTTAVTFPTYAYRSLCFPGLEDGFRRASIMFQQDASGNKLNYEIVDVQTKYAPPWPATRMQGRHQCSTLDGYRFIQHCQVQLTGPPHCDVRDLLQRAVQVCQYRLNYESVSGEALGGNQRIVEATITETIGDVPMIDVSIRVEEIGGTARTTLTRVRNRRIGTMQLPPLGRLNTGTNETEDLKNSVYQVNKHPIPAIYGYDEWAKERNPLTLAFFQCVLQSQCDGATSIGSPPVSTPDSDRPSKERINQTPVYQTPSVPELSDPSVAGTWPDGHLNAMYIAVAMNNEFDSDMSCVRLPVANGKRAGQPKATIIQLSEPTSMRRVTVDFERVGEPPQIPPFRQHQLDNGGPIFYPVRRRVEVLPPRYTADAGRLVYRARATYLYYGDRNLEDDAILPIGRLPIMGDKVPAQIEFDKLVDQSQSA